MKCLFMLCGYFLSSFITSFIAPKLASALGASRMTKEDKIDYSAGVIINKKFDDALLKKDSFVAYHP